MIISHALKYVYIGIPRTGSKSMNRWLLDYYQGEWYGEHHGWKVPDEARDYTRFTIVRNPYEREISAWYFVPWGAETVSPPPPANQFAELFRGTIALRDGNVRIESHETPEVRMNQFHFVRKSGVSLVLHFEHLPHCLKDLPFVDKNHVPPFPHKEERGVRPPGTFFDHFNADAEKAVWEYASDDFEAFGYHRYESGYADKFALV